VADKLFALYNHGVPGIVTSLKSNHGICIFSQQINDFAFALVSPLGTHNNDIGHVIFSFF
jgi:hypothetical protein